MSVIDTLHRLIDQARDLIPTDILITTDPEAVRPALNAGQTVLWFVFPETIAWPAYGISEVTWKPALISPDTNDPMAGLDHLIALAHDLEPLGVTNADVDSLQIASGPYWPALRLTLTTTERD